MDKQEAEIRNDAYVIKNPGIILQQESDHWGILYDPQTDSSFGINPVSVFIWGNLEEKRTIRELVKKVHENCQNVSEHVEEDVKQFIELLLAKGLATLEI